MALPFKILPNVGAVNFGAAGSAYTAYTAVTIASKATWLVPFGYQYIVGDGTAAGLQVSATAGNATPTWSQVNTTGYCGDVYSDGNSWRVSNNATTAIVINYFSVS